MLIVNKKLIKAIFFSWFVFFAALCSPLISADYENVTFGFFLYFFISYAVFYLMLLFVDMLGTGRAVVLSEKNTFFFRLFILFLVLTFFFRVLDRFYFRPVEDYFSIESYREARKSSTNLFSFLGSFLLPFFFVSMDACLQRSASLNKRKITLIPLAMVVLIFIDLLASGSRGVVLVASVMLLGRYFNFQRMLLALPVLVALSGGFFVYRFISLAGADIDIQSMLVSVSSLGYALFVPYSDFIGGLASEGNALLAVFPFLQANQYLAHGFFEFAYIFLNIDGWYFDLVLVLPHFAKLIDQSQEVLRPGMYYTMAGTAYNAFGFASIFFMGILGLLYGVILKSARFLGEGSVLVVLLSVFLLPFVNSFGGFDFYLYFIAILVLRFFASLNFIGGSGASKMEGV
ncbi:MULTISPECIES: hypothetical protein [unclassified Pseudomonas]|uniref:hypothetical protein n=1 Tax=unclassified Pseudomonas TaxID=196821 RepID=UPI001463B797|nr:MULTISPECIES: hypothetical protein [unclassified Pseudomonas]QJI16864.1 hypothetical protein HKK57_00800 [Pseudomonas sp. ADAK21]QJI22974.1 hypothetical protein HKK56_05490 [Pseudomonas sp. ADAK20]